MRSLFLGIAAVAVIAAASAPLTFQAVGQEGSKPKAAAKRPGPPPTSFAEDVFPIFKGRCLDCHQPGGKGYEASGLDLRTYEGLMKGTKFGPMVVPRDPDTSNLMWLLDWRASPDLRMPHGTKQLSICDRTAIRRWIMEGAKNN
ncbi:MAG: c-type cytochrome domain-containing protein [Xanthobacteraceae bacterium]|jgi:hypothetical protein|nr:c-type cytochrome domain-containing protein [Xanthobacteraceae bacterium]